MEVANREELIDYAMPAMKAERALREVHNAALLKDYDTAIAKAVEATVEARLLMQSLRIMQERGD